MPSRELPYVIASYSSASSLPSAVWNAFRTHEINSNIMYPHAIKSLKHSQSGRSKQHWITLASKHSRDSPYEIDLILSCTSWALGDYPIFIFTTKTFSSLSLHWLQPRLQLVIEELVGLVPLERMCVNLADDSKFFLLIHMHPLQVFDLRSSSNHEGVCASCSVIDRTRSCPIPILCCITEFLQSANVARS
jgi:hypothetical protein